MYTMIAVAVVMLVGNTIIYTSIILFPPPPIYPPHIPPDKSLFVVFITIVIICFCYCPHPRHYHTSLLDESSTEQYDCNCHVGSQFEHTQDQIQS